MSTLNWKKDAPELAARAGIHFPMVQDYLALDGSGGIAMDAAQPVQVTTVNAGIPAFLTNFLDPKIIDVLVSPMKAAIIAGGEVKKGDWTTATTQFPLWENAGEVSSYGDLTTGGLIGGNVQFISRQSYHYQTITVWGERELDLMGLAKVDWAARLNMSGALVMNKFQNKSYFYGITGLQNYGLLNDPSLPASITPITKTGGGNLWSAASLGLEVYQDILNLFTALVNQTQGIVQLDTPLVLAMSPSSQVALLKPTSNVYGNATVQDLIKTNFPNLKIETAPEYFISGGSLVQLIAPALEGVDTVQCGFTEKLRAHGIVRDVSSFKQKKSGGTWGALVFNPSGISSLLGV